MQGKYTFLICLTGLPASGKSTFARKLKKAIEHHLPIKEVKIVDPDIIRNIVTRGEDFHPELEHHVRAESLRKIENLLKEGYPVIIDDINYYSSMRHEFRELADELSIPFFIIYISTPLKKCLQWNEKRGKTIPNKVIHRINKKFDHFEKYEWDTPDLIIDLSQTSNIDAQIDYFLNLVEEKLKNWKRLREKKQKKKEIPSNAYHEKLDTVTRKMVGELLQSPHFRKHKLHILKLRKKFIKLHLDLHLSYADIQDRFKRYLANRISIKLK
ncbi:MAG: L-seryl-tRNA(Sec) kinase [Promethearchaeota archaeon]|nr:MAG: L-seryl-tRNA(Sec) kinase [Candidatus Lokiarchaeota archaeon]